MLSPRRFLLFACGFAMALGAAVETAPAQTTRETVVELTATTAAAPPHITLNWNSAPSVTGLKFWRREKGTGAWGSAITLGIGDVTYADATALPGVAYEYSFQRTRSTGATTAYGSIVAGYRLPLVEQRGKVCLLVDASMAVPLAPELALLERNLAGDGWRVFRHEVARAAISPASTNATDYAPRLAEVTNVRALVQTDYASAPGADWALLIVGRVPVPYSGQIAPDGHGDHVGSWPTDSYYADVDGAWTDTSVNNAATTLSDQRNRNVPGDGKFDQSSLPSNVEMQAGRVDFVNMTAAPTGLNETTLLRQYLGRNHQFRRGLGAYAAVPRRALIDDGFGYFGGEAFGASGYRNAIGFFGNAAGQVDALDWFGTLGTTPVLFAYGCGGGSFTSASGIGTTTYDFSRKDSKAVFCALFGSYFGDWDGTNNFLRAPLCGTQDSLGLANAWSGRGYFHFYHMALGETIGYGSRYSANNSESTATGGWSQNGFTRSIHYGLLGDPTLRLHTVRPPANVSAASTASGVVVSWQSSPDASLGYHVYVATSSAGPFTRLTGVAASTANPTGSPLSNATLTYSHTAAVAGTTYTYLVKALKLEASASGSYVNTSVGEMVQVVHQSPAPVPAAPTGLVVNGTAHVTYSLTWQDNATDETAYEIERRNPTTGAWSQIAAIAANSATYLDPAATAGQINHYRVRAVNANGPSPYTPEAASYNLPGIAAVTRDFQVVSKFAGNFPIPVRRYSGSQGNVSVNYATTAIVGTAGVDFTATSGTANWSHGVTGDTPVPVPILQPAGPQLTKVFRLTISAPGGGASLGNPANSWVHVIDPLAQSVPAPWAVASIGPIAGADPGYAEHVSGTFGVAVRSGDISGTADSCRFIHRTVNGDCRITARVTAFSSLASGGRWGLMLRNAADAGSAMNSALLQTGNSARRSYRTTQDSTADNATTQSSVPVNSWLRATRTGDTLSTEYSLDGTTWNALGAPVVLTAPTATMLAGLAVAGNNISLPEIVAYARFDNVEVLATPLAPASVAAAPTALAGEIALSWPASADATLYRLERSTQSGAGFTEIATPAGTTYTDTGLTGGVTYYYRLLAINVAYSSTYSSEGSAAPLRSIEAWRLAKFGTTGNSGAGANDADFDLDGLKNLVEYALGLAPDQSSAPPLAGRHPAGAQSYLTLTFARSLSATGVTLWVDVAPSLLGPWTALDPLLPANQTAVQNGVPAPGWQTLTIKDSIPLPSDGARFIRLRVTEP